MKELLEKYCIRNYSELPKLKERYGESLTEMYSWIKSTLDKMEKGSIDIAAEIPKAKHELFVKAACIYMIFDNPPNVHFSDDYRYLKKGEVLSGRGISIGIFDQHRKRRAYAEASE